MLAFSSRFYAGILWERFLTKMIILIKKTVQLTALKTYAIVVKI